jgi:hypothetical protein
MSYTPNIFVAGEVPTVSVWNELWANDAAFNNGTGIADLTIGSTTSLTNPYKFSVTLANSFSSGTAASVKVPFDTITYDTGSNFDAVTNHRFTAPIAGFYHFSASIGSAVTGANRRGIVNLFKNGTFVPDSNGTDQSLTSSQYFGLNLSMDLQLAANDYIEVDVYTDNGQSFISGNFCGFLISNT